ncbi:glycoside hydrolase family 32 protein [Alkalicoccobacillus gibsonii]|uniref:glycoside hydrolase family 32 protein n=1 Tax=Alkalicoccobacillus gibsonii TaxID=79881 RepID=UPI003F7BEACD
MYELYKEKYRPQFHFSPQQNWMNDPNGMVFFKGEYHLFFQYHPHGTEWGPMHWGHAISEDLIHWEEMPIALFPDEHGVIFSGCAVVDWNNTTGLFENEPGLVAIYTNTDQYPGSDRSRQRQSIAYSKDQGRSWLKYEGNPVLVDESITDFRDPKVFWHQETKKWVMVLATEQSITLYTSDNLLEWERASEFGATAGSHDGVWECPDLFPLPLDGDETNQKWVMIVSIGDNPQYKEGSRTQYFIGEFDGETFINDHSDDTILWLDHGRDNYAGVSWSDIPIQDGRRMYIGWMSNWRYANQVPTSVWRSSMTIPRELSLKTVHNKVRLMQQPLRELETIKESVTEHKQKVIMENDVIKQSIPPLCELHLKMDLEETAHFELTFHHSREENTTISYDSNRELLSVNREESGNSQFSDSFSTIQSAELHTEEGNLELKILLDRASVELFANSGEVTMTSLIFPEELAQEISLTSKEGKTVLNHFTITELASIW